METNKHSRETHSPVQRKALPLIQTSVISVAPVKGGLVEGRGCILSISLGFLRQRVRASPSYWAPKDRTTSPAADWGPTGSGLSHPHQIQGPQRSGDMSPLSHHELEPRLYIFSAGNVSGKAT